MSTDVTAVAATCVAEEKLRATQYFRTEAFSATNSAFVSIGHAEEFFVELMAYFKCAAAGSASEQDKRHTMNDLHTHFSRWMLNKHAGLIGECFSLASEIVFVENGHALTFNSMGMAGWRFFIYWMRDVYKEFDAMVTCTTTHLLEDYANMDGFEYTDRMKFADFYAGMTREDRWFRRNMRAALYTLDVYRQATSIKASLLRVFANNLIGISAGKTVDFRHKNMGYFMFNQDESIIKNAMLMRGFMGHMCIDFIDHEAAREWVSDPAHKRWGEEFLAQDGSEEFI